jgi:hypothetical protein
MLTRLVGEASHTLGIPPLLEEPDDDELAGAEVEVLDGDEPPDTEPGVAVGDKTLPPELEDGVGRPLAELVGFVVVEAGWVCAGP